MLVPTRNEKVVIITFLYESFTLSCQGIANRYFSGKNLRMFNFSAKSYESLLGIRCKTILWLNNFPNLNQDTSLSDSYIVNFEM